MSPVETPTQYRHRRLRKGLLHKPDSKNPHKEKLWKYRRDYMRETFIENYITSGLIPTYMITRNYYYEEHGREKVIRNNSRVGKVLEDLFNPRNKVEYAVGIDHFIERHKDSLGLNEKDEWVVKKGSYHVHTLISDMDERVLTRPNRKIKKLIQKIYGQKGIPDKEDKETTIMCLIDYALRDRCSFIGHSNNSLDIRNSRHYAGYGGYTGWKGMVSYVTKDMYSIDSIDEIFDYKNNKTLRGMIRKNEKQIQSKTTTNTRESTKNETEYQMPICV